MYRGRFQKSSYYSSITPASLGLGLYLLNVLFMFQMETLFMLFCPITTQNCTHFPLRLPSPRHVTQSI